MNKTAFPLATSQKALAASIQLHSELLNDACYAGYDADKESFDLLYAEVYVICRDELPVGASISEICETFHDYQLEQMDGVREIGWWM
jgi:hypothetical protein